MPLISIITPAYIDTIERNEWLNETLDSIFRQSFTDFEIILIDDASPITITTEFEGESRLRKIRTTRRSGPALARNTGVHLSLGNVLLPLDADDLLAGENVLDEMYQVWQQNQDKIIYGNLQRYDNGERGVVVKLPSYTFQKALDPTGLMPVTGMHSLECHQKAGGWKHELEAGLEDIEYWIAAGKAGFCGYKIDTTTLLYRRHDTSRHYMMRNVNKRESEMRNRMRLMHEDVYEGRFPMSCCGGSQVVIPTPTPNTSNKITTLDQYDITEKVWVQYMGKRNGSFQAVGQFTNLRYQIEGLGHKLEVHKNDISKFKRSGRGQDFKIGVQPPENYVIPEPTRQIEGVEFIAEKPIVTEIERYDPIAEKALGPDTTQDNGRLNLESLELPEKIHNVLQAESWTIENLALASEDDLLPYPGIGPQWAKEIIERAKVNG